jgi:hypothetical protein
MYAAQCSCSGLITALQLCARCTAASGARQCDKAACWCSSCGVGWCQDLASSCVTCICGADVSLQAGSRCMDACRWPRALWCVVAGASKSSVDSAAAGIVHRPGTQDRSTEGNSAGMSALVPIAATQQHRHQHQQQQLRQQQIPAATGQQQQRQQQQTHWYCCVHAH